MNSDPSPVQIRGCILQALDVNKNTDWRVMFGAKAGLSIGPKLIIKISRLFFTSNSLEWVYN